MALRPSRRRVSESLSHPINQKEIDDGTRVGVSTDDRQRIAELERRTVGSSGPMILKAAS
jgi:hypothetical protein